MINIRRTCHNPYSGSKSMLPLEVISQIAEYADLATCYQFSTSSTELSKLLRPHLQKQMRKVRLRCLGALYPRYGDEGMLYDALMSGVRIPFSSSTEEYYSEQVNRDVLEMLDLDPSLARFDKGRLRCRSKVTPFSAACVNDCVGLDVVKKILEHGTPYHCFDGYPVQQIPAYELCTGNRKRHIRNLVEEKMNRSS